MIEVVQQAVVNVVGGGVTGPAGAAGDATLFPATGTDLNTLVTRNKYVIQSPANAPAASVSGDTLRWQVEVDVDTGVSPNGVVQKAQLVQGEADTLMAIRRKPSGSSTWSGWQKVYAEPRKGQTCRLDNYGVVADYLISGGVNGSATNNTPAWNAIMAQATQGDTFIEPAYGSAGADRQCVGFASQPSPLKDACKLIGQGRAVGGFVRNYNNGSGDTTTVFLRTGLYTTIRDLRILSGFNMDGGIALGQIATSGADAAQDNVIENVFISGLGSISNGSFSAGIVFNSTLGTANFGSRSMVIRNVEVSRYYTLGVGLLAMNSSSFTGMDLAANSSLATGSTIDLFVSGVSNNTNNSCTYEGPSLDKVNIDNTGSCIFVTGAVQLVTIGVNCGSVYVLTGFFNGTPVINAGAANVRIQGSKFNFDSSS